MNATAPDVAPVRNAQGIAFLFPGQGSQSIGMLAALGAAHPEVQLAFAEASDGAGIDLWALAQDGPEKELNRTENTQPALLAAGVAVWRVWKQSGGPRPTCMAGHSLGEYSALVAAGVLSLHDAAALVAKRGKLMQQAVPEGQGAMAAVIGADNELVEQVCAQIANGHMVAPANYNAPGQVVISGHAVAVDRALAALAEAGVRKAVRLDVSVPSHCPLMRDAADELGKHMEALEWNEPVIPVIQNADASVHADSAYIRAALVRQLYMPVRWTECVSTMTKAGIGRMYECGPGKVLVNLARRIDKSIAAKPLGDPESFDAARAELAEAGEEASP